MAVSNSPADMNSLIQKIKTDYPGVSFEPGSSACWSPKSSKVFYHPDMGDKNTWALLHEIGHMRLDHDSFANDLDLLSKEVEAWEEASKIAHTYSLAIDDEHIQDCLDTYRDWLYRRSQCPTCGVAGVQEKPNKYLCVNCQTDWSVTSSRFCRPYRRTKALS